MQLYYIYSKSRNIGTDVRGHIKNKTNKQQQQNTQKPKRKYLEKNKLGFLTQLGKLSLEKISIVIRNQTHIHMHITSFVKVIEMSFAGQIFS